MVNLNSVLLFNGIYGVSLSLLIFSYHFETAIWLNFINLEKNEYSLGNYGQVWSNWLGTACLFAGLVNLFAYSGRWNFNAKKDACYASFVLFGIWSHQNWHLCLATNKFSVYMYFHSVTCGLSSLAALYAGLTAVEKKWKM